MTSRAPCRWFLLKKGVAIGTLVVWRRKRCRSQRRVSSRCSSSWDYPPLGVWAKIVAEKFKVVYEMSELIGRVLGNYHILEQIGRGGMASVYKAQDLTEERTVAIKVLSPQLAIDSNFKTRFEREAEVLRGLEHPNIVPILDYGEEGGLIYIVMPFMEVGTLSDFMETGYLNLEQSAKIIDQITSALQYAHDAGVIHRDVKPSNILIDEDGNAWLSDFGFAYVHDASLSLTGSALIGTPAYMAPEIVSGKSVTPASDQYSLAVVLYNLSTGCLPYDAETPMAIALSHVNQPLPRPREVNPDVPRSIEAVLLRALAKNPSLRFESIADFNRAFQEAVELERDRAEKLEEGSLFDRTLVMIDGIQAEAKDLITRTSKLRRYIAIVAILLLIVFPAAAAMDLLGFFPERVGAEQVANTEDLRATINALYTANIPKTGTVWPPGHVETVVAETLSLMQTMEAATDAAGTYSAFLTKTALWEETARSIMTITPSETPEPTSTYWYYFSPTPTRSWVRSPTVSPTPTVTKTPRPTHAKPTKKNPTSTDTPPPTETSIPPTATEVPQLPTSVPPTATSISPTPSATP